MKMKISDMSVSCLLYADDAVLIVSSECELQALVIILKELCENNGRSLNASKIKVPMYLKEKKKGRNARSV